VHQAHSPKEVRRALPGPTRPSRRRPRTHPLVKEFTTLRRTVRLFGRIGLALAISACLVLVVATPAFAAATGAPSLTTVIDNLRTWLVGILAGVATLFLTVGGLRYLAAGGDPSQVEKAKVALKSAAVGYALAILAPLLVTIIASVVGAG
jgi:hypothetical protein